MKTLRLAGKYFVAGLIINDDGIVCEAAPILRMQYLGKTENRVHELCRQKNIEIKEVE